MLAKKKQRLHKIHIAHCKYKFETDGIKMINTIEQFGRNAGRLWEMLDACGPLSEFRISVDGVHKS